MGEVIVAIAYSDTEILMEQDGIFDFIEEEKCILFDKQIKKFDKQIKKNMTKSLGSWGELTQTLPVRQFRGKKPTVWDVFEV